MKATAEKIDKDVVLLEVEVEAEQFTRAVDNAYRKLVKNYVIPGFRRGKTPRTVFERYIGREKLYNDAVEEFLPDAYSKAVEDTGIEPIDRPEVEFVQLEEGKPVVFKAKVLVKPEVKLGNYTGLEIKRPVVPVKPEDVDRELARMQEQYAELLNLEEGTIESGDQVIIDFKGTIDGEPFEGGEATNYSLSVGAGNVLSDLEEQLVGMALGEEKDITVNFPENYPKEELAGKKAVFDVVVREIKRKNLSPLNDDFAKEVSEFDTLEELRNSIENRLKESAQNLVVAQVNKQLKEAVVQSSAVDVPQVMIDMHFFQMKKDLEIRLTRIGLTLEKYAGYSNSSEEKLLNELRQDAEKEVRAELVLEAIGREQGFEVSEEEVQGRIGEMAQKYGQDPQKVKELFDAQGETAYIKQLLLSDKVLAFLRDQAVYTDETAAEAGAGEAQKDN